MKPYKNRSHKPWAPLVKHDLALGFANNRAKYVVALLCFIALCSFYLTASEEMMQLSKAGMGPSWNSDNFSLFDVLIYAAFGMGKYTPSPDNPFMLPIRWLTMQVLVAVIVGYYPVDDLAGYAPQVFVRMRGIWSWWLSKCSWIVSSVVAFYLLGLVVFACFAFAFGSPFAPSASDSPSALVNGLSVINISPSMFIAALLIAPTLSIALSLAQVALSLLIGPFMSFMALMTFYALSIYFSTPLLIGDYSMIARIDLVMPGGISVEAALAICIIVAITATAAGGFILNRRDLLAKTGS